MAWYLVKPRDNFTLPYLAYSQISLKLLDLQGFLNTLIVDP